MNTNIIDKIWEKIKIKNQDADVYMKVGDKELIYNKQLKAFAVMCKAGDIKK